MIEFHLKDVKVPGLDPEFFVTWINEVVESEGFEAGNVVFIFVSDAELLEMNVAYLNHDYYTDVITFDYSDGTYVSGDIFISVDRINDNSFLFKVPFFEELLRVVVHGVLHLCGYNDKDDEGSNVMRVMENRYIDAYVSRET